jgi:hypothetical protein
MVMNPIHSKSFVVDSDEAPPLRPFLEKIIDKKVDHVALGIFESIIDFFCTYFYADYHKRFEYRMSDLNFEEENADDTEPSQAKAIAEKVLHFMDGAPLYDRTHAQRIAIEQPELFNIFTREKTLGNDQILIDGKPVYFSPDPNKIVLFGKKFGTEEVFVTDVKECPELVIIYEREQTKNLKAWCVDTSQPTKKVTMGGQLPLFDKEIFLAQEIAPFAPPAPIVDSFP